MSTETDTVKATTTSGETLTATQTKTIKPGYQTTEFWLTFVATLLSMAYASGIISPSSTSSTAKAVALLAAALASMGYTVSRGVAKK